MMTSLSSVACTNLPFIHVQWQPLRYLITFLLSTAPEDAPASIKVVGNSPSSVFVSWIPPLTPNGIITGYNLYINYSDESPVTIIQSNTTSTNYTVIDLQPYQLVSVMISASTIAGEGPVSESVAGRARELGS